MWAIFFCKSPPPLRNAASNRYIIHRVRIVHFRLRVDGSLCWAESVGRHQVPLHQEECAQRQTQVRPSHRCNPPESLSYRYSNIMKAYPEVPWW